jgi:hypothetical protein
LTKPRTCPHCKQMVDQNYLFDEDLNFICGYCKGVVYCAKQDDSLDQQLERGYDDNGKATVDG